MDEIQESNLVFHELWGMYARGAGGQVVQESGVLATWAGVQWPIVNVVFLSSPVGDVEDLASRLKHVASFTGEKQHFGMMVVCEDWLPEPREKALSFFADHGWIQISQAHGMLSENIPTAMSVDALEYRRVDDANLRRVVAEINAAGYEVSGEMAREALDHESIWGEGTFGYVGYLAGEPVVTATTYVRDGYLYAALVATLPEFRSRGLAAAATSQSMQEASKASGLKRTILHATPMAQSVYLALGFRTVTTFPMFLPAAMMGAT